MIVTSVEDCALSPVAGLIEECAHRQMDVIMQVCEAIGLGHLIWKSSVPWSLAGCGSASGNMLPKVCHPPSLFIICCIVSSESKVLKRLAGPELIGC